MAIIYEKTLTIAKLLGRSNCEIQFVNLDGDYSDLCREAYTRNIVLTSISLKKFWEKTRKIVKAGGKVD